MNTHFVQGLILAFSVAWFSFYTPLNFNGFGSSGYGFGVGVSGSGLRVGVSGTGLSVGVSGTGLNVGISGSGLSLGSIQWFSSVVVNDRVMDTSQAQFLISGSFGTQSDLRHGQQVAVLGDLEQKRADLVIYYPDVLGPVATINAVDARLRQGRITVLGREIQLTAATVYEGITLESLGQGDILEISGLAAADGRLVATYVGRRTVPEIWLISGVVSSATATRFNLSNLAVESGPQTLTDGLSPIMDGDTVSVSIDPSITDESSMTITALAVRRVESVALTDRAEVEVEGLVESNMVGNQFIIQGRRTQVAPDTTILNGATDDLITGARVVVTGVVDANGVLQASSIVHEPLGTLLIAGPISELDASRRMVTVLGTSFSVRDTTTFDDASGFADLNTGDLVNVQGHVDGLSYVVSGLEIEDDESSPAVRGPITSIDRANLKVSVMNTEVSFNSEQTQIGVGDDRELTVDEFFDTIRPGNFIEAKWGQGAAPDAAVVEVSIEES